MSALNSGRRRPGIVLHLALLILAAHSAHSAPVQESDSTQVAEYDAAGASGCYYNFQRYQEGARIVTNEPCLNCTCHNRMLMCYLRVCPFTKAIGQDCTVEKRPDQCCPVITCPEVPVQLLTSTTSSPSQSSSTDLGKLEGSELGFPDTYGCHVEDSFYADGAQLPLDAANPCELCYCIRNKTTCLMQQCTLAVAGCKPVYQHGICCPVKYNCEYDEEYEAIAGTTPGLIMTTTLAPHATAPKCQYEDKMYEDGELIYTIQPCQHCYCFHGEIVCAVQECGKPMEAHGKNCTGLPPLDGECCPTIYQCDDALGDAVTTMPGSKIDQEFFPGADNVIPEQIPTTEKPETELDLGNEVPESEPTKSSASGIPIKDDDSRIPSEINTVQPHIGETGPRKSEIVTSEINDINELAQTTEVSPSITPFEVSSKTGENNHDGGENLAGAKPSESSGAQGASTESSVIQSETGQGDVDNQATKNQESPSSIITTRDPESEKSTTLPVANMHTEKNQFGLETTPKQIGELTTVESEKERDLDESSSPNDGAAGDSTQSREEFTVDNRESATTPSSSDSANDKKEPVSSETNEVINSESSTPVITGINEEASISMDSEASSVKPTTSDAPLSEESTPLDVEGSQPTDNEHSPSSSIGEMTNQSIGIFEITTTKSNDILSSDSLSMDSTLNQDSHKQDQSNEQHSSMSPPQEGNTEVKAEGTLSTETAAESQSNSSDQVPGSFVVAENTNIENEPSTVTEINIDEENSTKDILGEPEIPDEGPSGILIPERLPEHKAEDNDAIQDTGVTGGYIPNNTGMPFGSDNTLTDQPEYGPTTYSPPETSDESKRQPSSPHEELPGSDAGITERTPSIPAAQNVFEKTSEDSTTKILSTDGSQVEEEQPVSGASTQKEDMGVTQANIAAGSTDKNMSDSPSISSSPLIPSEQASSSEQTIGGTSDNDSENDIHSHINTSEYEPVTEKGPFGPITKPYEGNANPGGEPDSSTDAVIWTSEAPSMTESVYQDSTDKSYPPENPILTNEAAFPEKGAEENISHTGEQSPNSGGEASADSKDANSSTEISNAIIVETHKPEIIFSESNGATESPTGDVEQDHHNENIGSEIENKTELNEIIKDEAESSTSSGGLGIDLHPYSGTSDQIPAKEFISNNNEPDEAFTSPPKIDSQFSQNGQNQHEIKQFDSITTPGETVEEHSETPVSQPPQPDEEPAVIEDENPRETESENDNTPPAVGVVLSESSTTSKVGSMHGIPGEGNCLVDGQSYSNNSSIPPVNACQLNCRCISSIVQCELIKCTPPPSDVSNCVPVFTPEDLCCPMYTCETTSPAQLEADNQMSDDHKHSAGETATQATDNIIDKEPMPITEMAPVEGAQVNETIEISSESYSTVTSASPPESESQKADGSSVSPVDREALSSPAPQESTSVSRETEAPEEILEMTSSSASNGVDDSSASTGTLIPSRISEMSQTSIKPLENDSSNGAHDEIPDIPQSSVTESAVQANTNDQIGNLASTSEVNAYSEQNMVNDSNGSKLDTTLSSPSEEENGIGNESQSTPEADKSKETHDVESSQGTVPSVSFSENVTENDFEEHVETSTETYDSKAPSTPILDHSSTTRLNLEKEDPTKSTNLNEITTSSTAHDHQEETFTVSDTSSESTTGHHITSSETLPSDGSSKVDQSGSGTLVESSSEKEPGQTPESTQLDQDVNEMTQDDSFVDRSTSSIDKNLYSTASSMSEEPSSEPINDNASQEETSQGPMLFTDSGESQPDQSTEAQSKLQSDRPTSEVVSDQHQSAEMLSTSSSPREKIPGIDSSSEKTILEGPTESPAEEGTEISPESTSDDSGNSNLDNGVANTPLDAAEGTHDINEAYSAKPVYSKETESSHDSDSGHEEQPENEGTAATTTSSQISGESELPLLIKDAEIDNNNNSSSSPATEIPKQELSTTDDLLGVEKVSDDHESGVEITTKDLADEITPQPPSSTVRSSSATSSTIGESTEHPNDESMISTSEEKDSQTGAMVPEVSSQEIPSEMMWENGHSTTPRLSGESSSETNLITTYNPPSHVSLELSTKGTISTSSIENSDLSSAEDDHYHGDAQHTDEPIPSTSHEEEEHRPESHTSTAHPDTNKPHTRPDYPDQHVPETDDESIFPPEGADIKDPYDTSDPETEDYDDQAVYGPGTCRYGGKIYMSAQQIPRDDACDFCFCFRSDIICLQQSCPPPIPGCHEEPIGGFCCPRYECPVSMATSLNITTTTSTTTTTIPPHFLSHAYRGNASRGGCLISGRAYRVGEEIKSKSGPCRNCSCGDNGKMDCEPKACSASPMLKEMIAHAAARKRRRRAIHS